MGAEFELTQRHKDWSRQRRTCLLKQKGGAVAQLRVVTLQKSRVAAFPHPTRITIWNGRRTFPPWSRLARLHHEGIRRPPSTPSQIPLRAPPEIPKRDRRRLGRRIAEAPQSFPLTRARGIHGVRHDDGGPLIADRIDVEAYPSGALSGPVGAAGIGHKQPGAAEEP